MQAQFDLISEKYNSCKIELENTKVNCEKWVQSCTGFQMLLNKQSASNVKFGIGYNHTCPPADYTPKSELDNHQATPDLCHSKTTVNSTLNNQSQDQNQMICTYRTVDFDTEYESIYKPINFVSSMDQTAPSTDDKRPTTVKNTSTVVNKATTDSFPQQLPEPSVACHSSTSSTIRFPLMKPTDFHAFESVPYPSKPANKPFIPNYSNLTPSCIKCNKGNHSTDECWSKTPLEKLQAKANKIKIKR